MKLETFFKNFELLADAPNGVQKLRELILQLAVRGNLVPQDIKDKSVQGLFAKLREQKQRGVKEGKIRDEEPLPALSEKEIPFDLPSSWMWVRFGDAFSVLRGASPRPKGDPRYFASARTPYHWIKIGDIRKHSDGVTLTNTDDFLTEDGVEKSVFVKKGTLLLTNSATIGVPIFLGISGCIHDGYLAFPFLDELLCIKKYLYYFFLHFQAELKTRAFGGAQLNLNTGIVKNIPFPLPSFEEQKRIVAKVDQLMALCDELETRQRHKHESCVRLNNAAIAQLLTTREPKDFSKHWQSICNNFDLLYSVPENIGKLRQAILQLAVQGKLVPQDPTDEPVFILLNKFKVEKERLIKEKKIKKPEPLSSIELDDLPYVLPKGWKWVKLGEIAQKLGAGSTPKGGKAVYSDSGIKFLRSQNVWNDGLRLDGVAYITPKMHQRMDGTVVKPGDILLNITGASIGRSAVVSSDFDEGNVSQHVAIVRLIDKSIRQYIHLCLISPLIQNNIMDVQVGISREGLSMTRLKDFLIPMPPFNETKRIEAKVEQLMTLCNKLEAKLTQSQIDSEKLMDAAVRQVLGV